MSKCSFGAFEAAENVDQCHALSFFVGYISITWLRLQLECLTSAASCSRLVSAMLLVTLSLRTLESVLSMALLVELVELDHESTPVNGVDENEATGESVVAPGAGESNGASTCLVVVLRVDVEPTNLLDIAASGILRDAGYIEHADTGAVVGESGETIADVEVVIDGLDGVLVVAGDLGLFEAAEVPLRKGGVRSLVQRLAILEVVELTMKVTGKPSPPGPAPSCSSSSSFIIAYSCQLGSVTQP